MWQDRPGGIAAGAAVAVAEVTDTASAAPVAAAASARKAVRERLPTAADPLLLVPVNRFIDGPPSCCARS
ncbi:hypothetical protein GCM10027028_63300 [Streptomyces sundarbansensis]